VLPGVPVPPGLPCVVNVAGLLPDPSVPAPAPSPDPDPPPEPPFPPDLAPAGEGDVAAPPMPPCPPPPAVKVEISGPEIDESFPLPNFDSVD